MRQEPMLFGRSRIGWALPALALLLGVGFAEELLFRSWLWGELERQVGAQRSIGLQAAIFALVHPWYRLAGLEAIGLLDPFQVRGIVAGFWNQTRYEFLTLQARGAKGVVDAWRIATPDREQPATAGFAASPYFPAPVCLDRAYLSQNLAFRLRAAGVEAGADALAASDHLPLVLDFSDTP